MAVTKITGAGLGLPNADGNALGGASNEWSDLYLADSGVIYFGNDQDAPLCYGFGKFSIGKFTCQISFRLKKVSSQNPIEG